MSVIFIHNRCNNNCVMCPHPDNFWRDKAGFDLPSILEKVDRFYRREVEFVKEGFSNTFYISGGEPTLSPFLITVIKRISSFFPDIKISCLTNGRMFSYTDYAKELLQLGSNLELAIPIHGHNAATHDRITRSPGSFLQTIKGLENIFRFRDPTQLIEIRVIIHQLNYKFLGKIMEFIKTSFPEIGRLVFMFFEVEGEAFNYLKRLRLTYAQLLPYIEAIHNLLVYFPDVRFSHFPLCAIPLKFFPYVWRTLPDYEVSFLANCNKCNLKKLCSGIHKSYLKYIGREEFQPIFTNIDILKSYDWYHPITRYKGS